MSDEEGGRNRPSESAPTNTDHGSDREESVASDNGGAREMSDDDEAPPQAAGRNERVRARLAVPGLEIDEICF